MRFTLAPPQRFWRILSPRWSHAPLSGEGAARHGGRWNRPGWPALYLSEQIETAFAEYQQEQGVRPGTFVAYEVGEAMVVDLTDPLTLYDLAVKPADLLAPWKEIALVHKADPPTWRLADRLRPEFDGVRVPSAQYPDGINLVLYRWNEGGGPRVDYHDPRADLAPP